MVKYKYIDWICIGAAVLAILLTLLLMFGEQLGIPKASANPGYVTRLFDDSRVHTIDIQIADWGVFYRGRRTRRICGLHRRNRRRSVS